MSDLPVSLTCFGSVQKIAQMVGRSAIPLYPVKDMLDPFLPDQDTPMPFTVKEMFDSSVKHIAHLILGKSPPKGQPNHPLQKAVMRWRMEKRFNDESEVKEALQGLLPAMVEKAYNDAKNIHSEWQRFVASKRIATFYEKYQELSIWRSLGLGHRGAAIRFRCDEQSIFAKCQPAQYSKIPASTVSQSKVIEHMVGSLAQLEFDPSAILLRQDYSLRDMKEWRLVEEQSGAEETSLPIELSLIQGIYLGALVPEKNAEQMVAHVAKIDPTLKVFRARCKDNEFSFDFEKISADVETEESPDQESTTQASSVE